MNIALWVIAVCAALWTLRMLWMEWLGWIAARYPYGGFPSWIKRILEITAGGR